MITLSSIIDHFEAEFLSAFQGQVLSHQIKAVQAMKICRTSHSPVMQVSCTDCDHQTFVPQEWVVDCKQVGSGDKALIYLGRYLYRGVIREKDILSCKEGHVTYRYQNSKTKQWEINTVSGARFLWLVLQHMLPKGFRRARNYGFLHPNSKQLIRVLQCLLKFDPKKLLAKIRQRPQLVCQCCGAKMEVSRTRIPVAEVLTLAQILT